MQLIKKFGYNKSIYTVLGLILLSNSTGCTLVSHSIAQVREQNVLRPSNRNLKPSIPAPSRASLEKNTSTFLDRAQIGDKGQIIFDGQTINVTVDEIYYAANGRLCKKAMVAADSTYPSQQLALCQEREGQAWTLTRSILSSVTF